MRKLRKVFVILFLLSFGMPLVTMAQAMEKITVRRDGSLRDQDGKPLSRKLFALSTYDADGKKAMEKGRARFRPETMYIDKAVLKAKSLSEVQLKIIDEYLRAEPKPTRTGRKRIIPINRGANPKKTDRSANLSEDQMDVLVEKVIAKLKADPNAKFNIDEFQKEIDKIVEKAKADLRNYAASLAVKSESSSNDGPAGPDNEQGWFAWGKEKFFSLFSWDTNSPWYYLRHEWDNRDGNWNIAFIVVRWIMAIIALWVIIALTWRASRWILGRLSNRAPINQSGPTNSSSKSILNLEEDELSSDTDPTATSYEPEGDPDDEDNEWKPVFRSSPGEPSKL